MTMFKKTVLWQQVFNDRGLTLAQLLLKYYKSFGPILFFFYFNVEVTILIKIFSQKCVIFIILFQYFWNSYSLISCERGTPEWDNAKYYEYIFWIFPPIFFCWFSLFVRKKNILENICCSVFHWDCETTLLYRFKNRTRHTTLSM